MSFPVRTLLFFDDEPLNYRDNLARKLGRATPIPGGAYRDPRGNASWGYPGILRDPASGIWRAIYQMGHIPKPDGGYWLENCAGCTLCVAESSDGIHWAPRDTTAIVDLPDRRVPNQLPLTGVLHSVFEDPHAAPDQRFKLLGSAGRGFLHGSPDGLNWRPLPGVWHPLNPDPPTFVHWNPYREAYLLTGRAGHSDRRICLNQTTDWETFSPHELLLHADSLDTPLAQLYGFYVIPYGEWFIGLLWIFHLGKHDWNLAPHKYLGGRIDIQLAYSRNGWAWHRTLREPFIPNGAPGSADAGCIQASSFQVVDDGSLRIYAATNAHEHGRVVEGDGFVTAYELRKDGFIYLESEGGPGFLGTRALHWNEGELELNVQCPQGLCRVQLTDARTNQALPGFSYAENEGFSGDTTDWVPRWQDNRTVAQLAGKMFRIEVELTHGRLYALRGCFEPFRLGEVQIFEKTGEVMRQRPGF